MQDGVMGEEEEEDKGTRGNTANAIKVYIMVISAAKKIVWEWKRMKINFESHV